MSETRIRSRVYRPPAARTWELVPSGSGIVVSREDEGELKIWENGTEITIPGNLVDAFGKMIAEAVAWKDDPDV